MTIESEAIPYEPARLLAERLLVLAPHPDDEVIGCGGLVAQHLREGRTVRVVVATDGGQAGDRQTREQESQRALELLGTGFLNLRFLGHPDRELDAHASTAAEVIREELLAFRPDLIAVPSPIEIHPDHLALSRLFCALIQRDDALFSELAIARVAFYEVGQPLRPNALVDISDVAEAKYAAIAAHDSQLAVRDYVAYARGLNAYRSMTLPAGTTFAEGYYVVDLPSLRTLSFGELRERVGVPPPIEVKRATLPITVVVRTKDRPALLRDALQSIRNANHPAAEIVVVNDGGAHLDDLGNIKLIEHETSRGRSEAANAGVRAAQSEHIVFLDDDDLHYPEHLETLANAAASQPERAGWYSDALSVFLRIDETGRYAEHSRLRLYGQDFDRELLLIENYIPLPTILFRRTRFLDLGGFDPAFDLFEDWDFLIRLAQTGDFTRVPRVTCEIRHFEGGGSIILGNPEGSDRFRKAKLQVWSKHRALLTDDAIADAFERQKRRAIGLFNELVEQRGARSHALLDIGRLEREKASLICTLGERHAESERREIEAGQRYAELEAGFRQLEGHLVESAAELEKLREHNAQLEIALAESGALGRTLYAEIDRLQSLLEMIYRSRTWKLHTMVEKMKGRG